MSVNHLNLSLQDVIRALVYCAVCLMVQCTREEICSSNPAAQLHLRIYVSIGWQAVLNWVARPMTLLIALISECILCLSISLSHRLTYTHVHSLAAFNWSPWWSLLAAFHLSISELCKRAPMPIAMCKRLYIRVHTCKHRQTHTHRFEVCYLPSVLPAGEMLHFSQACYINKAVVYARHTPLHWSLPSHPDRSTDHTTATPNAIITDLILTSVSISHYKSGTNLLTYIFIFNSQFMLYTDDFSGQVANTVSTGKWLSYVPGIEVWINKQDFALIDVTSCLSPVADGSRWNRLLNAAWWLTSDSETSHGAFCFLKFGLNTKVGA